MTSRTRSITLLLVAFALLVAACGGDGATTSTAPPSVDETSTTVPETSAAPISAAATSTTPAPGTTATTAAPSTTNAEAGAPECLTYWPEQLIQSLAGANWTFVEANIDGTLCTFSATPDTIAVFFRESDQALFDMAKEGAALTGTLVELTIDSCTDAYFVDIGGLIVAESFSQEQGRAFNATLAADDAITVATALIKAGCDGPDSN